MIVTIEVKNHVENQCLTPKVIYEVTLVNNSDNKKQVYIAASDTTFKD